MTMDFVVDFLLFKSFYIFFVFNMLWSVVVFYYYLWVSIYLFVCLCDHAFDRHECGSQTTPCRIPFSPLSMSVPELKFRSSGLVASTLPPWCLPFSTIFIFSLSSFHSLFLESLLILSFIYLCKVFYTRVFLLCGLKLFSLLPHPLSFLLHFSVRTIPWTFYISSILLTSSFSSHLALILWVKSCGKFLWFLKGLPTLYSVVFVLTWCTG